VENIFEKIIQISQMGTTILLVEQNAKITLSIANRGYVLEVGNLVLADTGENLLKNEQVRKSYLGEK
jgi:branched-chain amino acid transport system ATP-binding protein